MAPGSLTRKRTLRRASGTALLLLLLAITIMALENRAAATTTTDEMITFNHQKHIAAGAQCVFCHPGVLNGPVATIPSLAKCMGCHQNIEISSSEGEVPLTNTGQVGIDVLMRHWEEGAPLRWEKTHDQPDFVYFTHQPHIAAGGELRKLPRRRQPDDGRPARLPHQHGFLSPLPPATITRKDKPTGRLFQLSSIESGSQIETGSLIETVAHQLPIAKHLSCLRMSRNHRCRTN